MPILFTTIFHPLSVTANIKKDPPSMSITINSSSHDLDVSNLSMTSVVGALSAIGADVRRICMKYTVVSRRLIVQSESS
jgi:hypothetical protein